MPNPNRRATNLTITRTSMILAMAAIAIAANAQTAVSSTFSLGALADANQNDSGSHQQTYFQSQGATLNPYSGSVTATDSDLLNPGRNLKVTSSATAQWINAGQGSVAWRGMGWQHNTIASSGSKLNGFVTNQPVWSYTFTSTTDSFFTMNYDVRGTGDVFGLLGATIQWSGPGGDLNLTNSYNPAANGVFTRSLTAGTTYTVGLYNMGNVFTSPLPNTTTGSMDADFNWSVGAVPEPSTLAALGTLMVMGVRRRRIGKEKSSR